MSNFMPLIDSFDRKLRYLRMSVTDRCNLNCMYCVNTSRQKYIPHEKILRYEELSRLAGIFHQMGVEKLRITGGEPFVRKGLLKFLAELRSRLPGLEIAITTNGTLLNDAAGELARIGLSSINISLDTFDEATYHTITGFDGLKPVLSAIDKLLELGQKVKLNAVAIKGITDAQIEDYIYAIRNMPVDMRFIEYMPMGGNTAWNEEKFLSNTLLLKMLEDRCRFVPAREVDDLAGPARMFDIPGAKGRFGLISAISSHFCNNCQRMRLTSDGNLRACLFADFETRLGGAVRNSKIGDLDLMRIIARTYSKKPLGETLLRSRLRSAVAVKQMVGIGG